MITSQTDIAAKITANAHAGRHWEIVRKHERLMRRSKV